MSFTSGGATPARWRDVYLAGGARGISFCGDLLAATALMLALQQRGAGGYAVAALLIAAMAPAVVLTPLAGRLAAGADPAQRRRVAAGPGWAHAVADARRPAARRAGRAGRHGGRRDQPGERGRGLLRPGDVARLGDRVRAAVGRVDGRDDDRR